LMPSQMVINTESTVAYNNRLKQAVPGMKLGANNDVNPDTKQAALHLMAGGPSKINPPNSHPSNLTHKAATAESKTTPTSVSEEQKIEPTASQNGINKAAVVVGAVGAVALLIMHGMALKLASLFNVFLNHKGYHR